MSGYVLNHRLLNPTKTATLAELADLWEHHRLTVRVVRMGQFIQCPSLLNKIRGSLGHVLAQSGSSAVEDRQPCDWSQVCPAEPLYAAKPQIKIGPYLTEITKPYRLTAQRDGQDLLVSINLFGFSKVWIEEVKWALIFALREFVAWNVLAQDGSWFVPRRVQITEAVLVCPPLRTIDRDAKSVTINFRTPVDAERGKLSDRPHALFERLFLRVSMLARWHDVHLIERWDQLAGHWTGLDYEFERSEICTGPSVGGHKFRNTIHRPNDLRIKGDLSDCVDLLRIGENAGFGRGAVIGFGSFSVNKF